MSLERPRRTSRWPGCGRVHMARPRPVPLARRDPMHVCGVPTMDPASGLGRQAGMHGWLVCGGLERGVPWTQPGHGYCW
jgi:hypothetical protein